MDFSRLLLCFLFSWTLCLFAVQLDRVIDLTQPLALEDMVFFREYSPEAEKLVDLLYSYHYSRDYEAGVFDCSQTSMLLSDFLRERNYTTLVAVEERNGSSSHAYVVVKLSEGWVPVETTSSPTRILGVLRAPSDSNNTEYYDYEELYRVSSQGEWTTNETIIAYASTLC